ncbi:MAG: Tfp pilus assembly protein PilZ, partial [Candidatus Aldehydirespiratoraceae bacterium]
MASFEGAAVRDFRQRTGLLVSLALVAAVLAVASALPAAAVVGYPELEWATRAGGTSSDYTRGVAVDSVGNVYTTGYFAGTADFDPDPVDVFNLTSAGGFDVFVQKLDSDGDFVWATRIGGTSTVAGFGVAVDSVGNVYTTGQFSGTADFDPDPVATFNLTSAGSYDVFVQKLDSSGDFVWATRTGGTSNAEGRGLVVDSVGNVYITGNFEGAADFDPDLVDTFNLTSAGSDDVFVQKLDLSGDFVWATRAGGTDWDQGLGVAVDSVGNVYITGDFYGTADFDPDPVATFNLTSAGSTDVFVQKLDSSGNFVWATRAGGISPDVGYGVGVDSVGNVYITGDFYGTADFDPDPVDTFNLTSAGSYDVFVQKLDSSGNFVWATRTGNSSSDGSRGLVVDGLGNVYITGNFQGAADFDPDPVDTFNLTSAGSDDVFVQKLDSSGDFVWAIRIGGTDYDYGLGVAVDGVGNVYITG